MHHRTQKSGAGGGAGGLFKLERIALYLTGRSIAIDLRGAQIPTPKPRPHIPVLSRPGGFTAAQLRDVSEKAEQWMFSRSIGVLSRVVTFTLDDWEDCTTKHDEATKRAKVSGELVHFTEFVRSEFPDLCDCEATEPPYTFLDPYD